MEDTKEPVAATEDQAPSAAATPSTTTPPSAPTAFQSLMEQYELPDTDAAAPEPAESAPPPQPTPAAAEPEPIKHPRGLKRMATELGLGADEIDTTPTDQLSDIVAHLNAQKIKIATESANLEALRQARDNAAKPAPEPAPVAEPDDEIGDDVHPAIAKALRRNADLMRAQAKEIESLKAQLTGVVQRDQVREQATIAERCDNVFSKHPDIFGKGAGRELKDKSAYMRRCAALQLADLDKDAGTLEQKISRAIQTMYPDLADATEPAAAPSPPARNGNVPKNRLTAEQWREGSVRKPTARSGASNKPGKESAVQAVAEKLQEFAQETQADDSDVLDGFPE